MCRRHVHLQMETRGKKNTFSTHETCSTNDKISTQRARVHVRRARYPVCSMYSLEEHETGALIQVHFALLLLLVILMPPYRLVHGI